MQANNDNEGLSLQENFNDFFEHSLCGYVITDYNGFIQKTNQQVGVWTGHQISALNGRRFSDLLSTGGRIYYETHLAPLLQIQGYFDEVALELSTRDRNKMNVFVNALVRKNDQGEPLFIRFTVLKATDRHLYENNLRKARTDAEMNLSDALQVAALREQFIAVLGHDLRNPLGAIIAGAAILADAATGEADKNIAAIIARSAGRMGEMIKNILDFAIARLGGGMNLTKTQNDLTPVLMQVIDELKVAWPNRVIESNIVITEMIECDAGRIAQLFSNLLANALTHGDQNTPVQVSAHYENEEFELSVCNAATPLPADHIKRLFEPFTRENARPSQNGLGLGLYIASEISRAHGGTLVATSNATETKFTFRMPSRLLKL